MPPLKYLILWIYLFSYTIGFANLAICLVAWLQSRDRAILYFLAIFCSYTLYDLMLNVGFFANSMVGNGSPFQNWTYFVAYSLVNALFIIVGTNFIYFFAGKPVRGFRRLFFYGLASIPLILLGIELLGGIMGSIGPGGMAWFLQVDYILTLGCVYYAVFLLLNLRQAIRKSFFGPSMVKGLVLGLVLGPIGLLQIYWNFYQGSPLRPLTIENIYYFACNAISAVVFAKYYLIKPYRQPIFSPPIASHLAADSDECLRQFRRVYGITEREAEIISQIRLGLTNKQMADRLCIAPITVKNHIYNIYAKTQVSTRMELINLLMSTTEQPIDSN